MKQSIRLYIIPTYKNSHATNSYVFDKENENTLDIVWLDNALTELKNEYNILQTEICGGEITSLSDFYFNMLFHLIQINCNKIIVSTDFIDFNKSMINYCDIINVKYNFNGYSKNKDIVYSNIKAAVSEGKIINIKSLDISCKVNSRAIIDDLNKLRIKSCEIVPYHQSIYSKVKAMNYHDHEELIKQYLFLVRTMKFAFQNKLQLDGILPIDNYNVKNIYITPNNKFAVTEFDKDNKFKLCECDDLSSLQKKIREMENLRDNFCYNCDSKLRCLANRLINLNYIGESCSGFKDLIKYYDK